MKPKQSMSASEVQPVQSSDLIHKQSFLDIPLKDKIKFNWETIIFVVLILLAVFSRFYDLESRVMSHDENTHVYFSFLYSEGGNYVHDPLSHGPFQFHMVALSYLLFGDSDVSARYPAAVFGIAAIAFLWAYRRYFGTKGVFASMLLFIISPFMLYYSRYVRNEAFVMLFGVMSIWAMLRFLESGKNTYLYMLTAVTSLHIATKETGYIYTAQILIFLGLYFIYRINQFDWKSLKWKRIFNLMLMLIAFGFAAAGIIQSVTPELTTTGEVASKLPFYAALGISALMFLGALIALGIGYTLKELRKERTTSIMLLLFTLMLPQLSALPIFLMGWDTTHYDSWLQISHILTILVPFLLISIGMGVWWNWKEWLINNAIFYSIFVVFFTSLFTNSKGILSGFVGSLGYWLEQHAVARGGQPWFYYLFLQIPFYEFLALLGTLGAIVMFAIWTNKQKGSFNFTEDENTGTLSPKTMQALTVAFLIYWTVMSMIAYTVAGEKMPWLSVHIALPMLLLAGWFIGKLLDKIDWQAFQQKKGIWIVLLISLANVIFTISLMDMLKKHFTITNEQWISYGIALLAIFILIGLTIALFKDWDMQQRILLIVLLGFVGLGFLTTKSSIISSFYKYDSAEEFLVYAHSGPGVKTAMAQIEEISLRQTGGKDIVIAYDNLSLYPFWWYLRDYKNQRYFAEDPTKDIREAPVILVGQRNYGKVEPILKQAYDSYEYVRVWWPNQDYWNPEFLMGFLKEKETRWDFVYSILQIWLNHDYSEYALLTNRDFSLENWSPSEKFRLYVRKDVASTIWEFGAPAFDETLLMGPYDETMISMTASSTIFLNDEEFGSLNAPRDIALTDHQSFYVADSRNHRIVQFSIDGEFISTFGSSSAEAGDTFGFFNEPWGLTVAEDGSIFVADTWDHQIEKFDANENYVTSWGVFATGEDLYAMYGPRDVVIDNDGNILMTDTGNKRITVFSQDGFAISSFGGVGYQPGEFDEPVGLAFNPSSNTVYVADTWNQRMQSFLATGNNGNYASLFQWDVNAWYGQDLDNKPYITVAPDGNVLVTDPGFPSVIVFSPNGDYLATLVDESNALGFASGIAVTEDGKLLISDGKNNMIHMYDYPSTFTIEVIE